MELELKHIAPYLPYSLKVMVGDGAADEIIIIYPKDLGFQTSRACFGNINEIKPILRPISSITVDDIKELVCLIFGINSDGFKFNITHHDTNIRIDASNGYVWLDINILKKHFSSGYVAIEATDIGDNESKHIDHSVYEYLFSKHFDVFNLIEQGLAVEK